MVSDLFGGPWKPLIAAVVLTVLFSSKKLPQAACYLGKSLRNAKTQVGGPHKDEPPAETLASAPTGPAEGPVRPAAGPAATPGPRQT